MPKLREGHLPTYRLHKQSGQAIVTLSGRDFLLGKHGSAASKQEYRRLTAEWLANEHISAPVSTTAPNLTVAELVLAFWRHATTYYRLPTGEQTGELDNVRRALKPLRQMYDRTTAASFGPLALKAVREHMVGLGWCRSSVNRQTARLKHVFKWAAENELVPGSVYQGLAAVAGLRSGRTRAKEAPPVEPVSVEAVEAVLPYVSRQIKAMFKLQLVTGMRPAEVCSMRGCDITRPPKCGCTGLRRTRQRIMATSALSTSGRRPERSSVHSWATWCRHTSFRRGRRGPATY